jgi:hypothetical protein
MLICYFVTYKILYLCFVIKQYFVLVQLLETAKRAVGVAIEKNENAALQFIKKPNV